MNMRRVSAILIKQMKDIFKNKEVLILFILFPLISIIMHSSINLDGLDPRYFVILFATMFIGMAPLTSMASIIAEEKEKCTLRVLLMANVKPHEYLCGIGVYVFLCCIVGAVVFGITGNYTGFDFIYFMLIMAAGIITSMLLGAVIGIWSKNQMTASSLTVPIMMVFAFLPMLSMFNDKISVVSRFTYTQQINNLIQNIGTVEPWNVVVIMMNLLLFLLLFVYLYKKKGLA